MHVTSSGKISPFFCRLRRPLNIRNFVLCSPETVESLFIAFRLTGNKYYREQGWRIFQAIEKHCRITSGGYAGVLDVDSLPVKHEDKMETFFMVNSKFFRF